MVAIPFSTPQMTLMAVFILMAHALIQEGIIQGKSGIHPLKATLVRIGAATVTVLLMVPWVGSSTVMPAAAEGALSASPAFLEMIRHWAWTTFRLTAKIFVIIMVLLTLLELLKAFGWIHPFVRALGPFLRIMGLDQKVGFLWMTRSSSASTAGRHPGGESGHLSRTTWSLHLSIGMNHSMVDALLSSRDGHSPFLDHVLGSSASSSSGWCASGSARPTPLSKRIRSRSGESLLALERTSAIIPLGRVVFCFL